MTAEEIFELEGTSEAERWTVYQTLLVLEDHGIEGDDLDQFVVDFGAKEKSFDAAAVLSWLGY
ncbi:hypothetical protein [Henriciella pelagia]|uniref:hypothetical protein n=1 Tax=Henriciella pelagia TaxID=1977912 RepID=UPI003516E169